MNVTAILAKNRIAKNTSVLVLAQIASRALGAVYLAALARYIGAEGIGKISTANALNGLLVLVVAPGLNTLLVRDIAADTKKSGTYMSNALFLRGVLAGAFVLLVVTVTRVAGYPGDTAFVIRAYMVVYLIDSLGQILASVFRAFERMEYDAGSQIVRDVINVSVSLLAIHLHQSLLTIVYISVVAQACKFCLMMAIVYGRFPSPDPRISFRTGKTLLISSLPFGVLLILFAVQIQLGTLVLSLYHTAATVGLYAAAITLITVLLLLPSAFSLSIYPTFSKLYVHDRHELQLFYQICYKYLLVVGFPLGLGTMLVGERVIVLVYGHEFEGSATVIRILAVFLFTIVGYCNGPLLNAVGMQRFFAWTQGVAVGATGILCFLLIPKLGPVGAAVALVLPGIATFFIHSIASHRQVGLSLPWAVMGKTLLAAFLMGLVASVSLGAGVPWLAVVFLVAPSTYGVVILLLGITKKEELRILAGSRV